MTVTAANILTTIETVQSALYIIYGLNLTEFRYSCNCSLSNNTYYDYIIVGGGSAGSALAYRLSENSSNSVLLIEEGSLPPIESEMAAMFTPMPRSSFDYNVCTANDNYTAQNLQNSCISLTSGKMIGGSSNINHMIHVQGDPHDYNNWADILNDTRWNYTNVLKYFKKLEHLTDLGLLSSSFVNFHGTDGMIKISREIAPENENLLLAFAERNITIVQDITSNVSSLGATNPLFTIGDNLRQSGSTAYLAKAKNRTNLCIALSTKATKILIENGTAVGVQVKTSSGETVLAYANKEVIVSAGAIHSPQLLILSGIGPKAQLEELGITVVADLPVGEKFMDHISVVLLIQMEKSNATVCAVDPYAFPVPTVTANVALNSSQTYPDYQTINLLFPHDSSAMMELCSNSFKYSNDICNKFGEANIGRDVLFVVHNLMMPKSYGNLTVTSTNHTVEPTIYSGSYSNSSDLELMTECLMDYIKILNTTYYEGVNATFVDVGLCSNKTGSDYWKCYALAMSATMWHYSGTCAMGSVVDSELQVIGIDNLRVVDASVMPTLVSGNINAAVTMIAEVASELILAAN